MYKMVKVEEAPHKKIEREIQDNICNIQSCLHPPDLSFSLSSTDSFGDFEGQITEVVKKTETYFFRKREVRSTNKIATVHFKSESNSLYIWGNENQLRDIGQKLEDAGYNVIIWT